MARLLQIVAVMRSTLASALLVFGACMSAAPVEDGADDKIGSGLRRALFIPDADVEGNYAVTSARSASQLLRANNWSTELAPVTNWNDVFADLDRRVARGERYDLIVTLSHAGYDGPMFDGQLPWWSPDGATYELNARGIMKFGTQLSQLLEPDGTSMFVGCNTGNEGLVDVVDVAGQKYATFAHAVAHQSGRRALGTRYKINLGHAPNFIRAFFFESGTHAEWRRVEPDEYPFRADSPNSTRGAEPITNAEETTQDEVGCGLGDAAHCDLEAWYDDTSSCCDPCVTDDPDCADLEGDICPEAWRADPMGVCDECLGDDPDCVLSER